MPIFRVISRLTKEIEMKRKMRKQRGKVIKSIKEKNIPKASSSNQFSTNFHESLSDMEDDNAESESATSIVNLIATAKPSPIIITNQNSSISSIS